jgi:hypothetical protein
MKFAIPGEDNPDAPESLRRWNIERRNCYKGFGSFGLTKPPTTPVGVMRPVTPHSRQGCRQNLAVVHDGLSPSATPIIFPNCN